MVFIFFKYTSIFILMLMGIFFLLRFDFFLILHPDFMGLVQPLGAGFCGIALREIAMCQVVVASFLQVAKC